MNPIFILDSNVVTENKEIHLSENLYNLELDGYYLLPIDKHIPIYKTNKSASFGECIIQSITWSEQKTIISYELLSLHSVD